jgi:hypothetical protein
MKILDSKGRLFGKVSILDLGAGFVILMVIVGIFFIPGTTGSVASVSQTKPIGITLLVKGLSVKNPDTLLQTFKQNKKTDIIIRNQPAGSIEIESVDILPQTVLVPQPDGTVKALPDPRTDTLFGTDLLMNLVGQGQMTENGAVMANQKVKIGTVIELDGLNYNFRGSIIDVQNAQGK